MLSHGPLHQSSPGKYRPNSHGLLHAFSFHLCFFFAALVLGQCRCAYIVGGGDSGMGHSGAMEVACATAMLIAETSAREAVAARDSTALHVKDAEDRAALVEREALQRVSRVEVENTTVLASAHEDAEGLAWKIALLEDELAAEHRALKVCEREHRNNSRSSPFCKPMVPSCVMPRSLPHR
jgi:hypothetical protein